MTISSALIVENSKTFQAILADIFSSAAIETDFATDANMALNQLSAPAAAYSIVIVSSASLGDDIERFAKAIRTIKTYTHIPLLLLTTDKDYSDRRLYAAGYTQIFSRTNVVEIKSYIDHFLLRDISPEQGNNKVAIIEDDLPQQLVLKAILEEGYCECRCFKSAEDILTNCESYSPDVIVVDFFLEGKMTGMEFIGIVRNAAHPWHRLPIIAVTALDDAARKYELLRAGANDYLVKPMEPVDVTVRVENLAKYKRLMDMVELQREEMQYLAMHDQLTGLYNRHYLAEQVGVRLREAVRHDIPYSIIVLDIDYFKKINDNLGHDKGDEVLVALGRMLNENFRSEDTVARLGGEEFIVFMGHCDLDYAMQKAEQLRRCLAESKVAGLDITASFGVAQLSKTNDNFDRLFKAADEAVYRAKNGGRNRVEPASL